MLYNLKAEIHVPLCLCSAIWNTLLGNTVSCLLLWSLRSDMRRRYSIEGDMCTDGLISWLLPTCALQQQLLEMTSLGAFPGALLYAPNETVML